jgi:hypothetical protein
MAKVNKKSISISLATATCSLLGITSVSPVQAQEEPAWDFNTALLYYGEADGRVQDGSFKALVQRRFEDDRILSIGFAVDTLTGATPNGAIPYSGAQTFTAPSGESTYTTEPNEIPLDGSFVDTRIALTANWLQPLGRLFTINAGLSGSSENDYTHFGANLALTRDFNKRNTTLSLGVAVARDDINPVGGTPVPFSPMLDAVEREDDDDGDDDKKIQVMRAGTLGDQRKDVYDLIFGVTQVVNRNLLFNFNYSYSESGGYLNDPYKILSLVDEITGDPIARTPAPGTEGPSHEYRYENRPDERTKHGFFGQAKYFMSGKVLDLSYRYMTDDWNIDSHTVDMRYRLPFKNGNYFEPHIRLYTQTAADFYQITLVDGTQPFSFASSDYRLGEFDAITVGMKFGWNTRFGKEMSIRLEYYKQDGDAPADQIFGNQADRELYPDLDAIIAQFSYKFGL